MVIIVLIFIGGVAVFNQNELKSVFVAKDNESLAPVSSDKIAVQVIRPKEVTQSEGLYLKSTLEAH